MIPRELAQFEKVRVQARAYLCLLLNKSVPNFLPDPDLKTIVNGIKILKKEQIKIEALYVLNPKGEQITNNISANKAFKDAKKENRSGRAYYYRAVREKKCVITSPYPSTLTNSLTVTASYPVYDDNKNLKFIVCVDIGLSDLLKFAQPTNYENIFEILGKTSYALLSTALLVVAIILFYQAIQTIFSHGFGIRTIEINEMFKVTILLTLSLAILDLVKTIFQEEVLGQHDHKAKDVHHTMVKFLGSIIIALSIEALMLVFKFALTEPEKIINAVYILAGVGILLVGLSVYLKATENKNDKC